MQSIRERLVEKLLNLGLSPNEAKAYIALLEKEAASPLEIASTANIPVSKIYFVLNELEKKGLIESQHSRPKIYRVANPERSLRTLAERYIKAEKEAISLIKKISSMGNQPKLATFWVIRGRRNIINRVKEMIDKTKYSLAIATTDNLIEKMVGNIRKAVERNVNISITILKTNDVLTRHIINAFRHDAVIKVREILVPSVFLCDDNFGIVYITESLYRGVKRRAETALLVEDPDFLPVFSEFFRLFIWYPSKLVSNLDIFLSKPRTYLVFFRAVEDARYLLSKGIQPYVILEGRLLSDEGKRTTLKGKVIDAYESLDKTVYNITVMTEDGEKYLAGGKRCIIEEFETEKITLYTT